MTRKYLSAALSLVVLISSCCRTDAYPIIAEIDEEDETCFRYNIPHGDDAHMVFVALPNHVEDQVEDWFVTQANEMTKKGAGEFVGTLPTMPEEIKKATDGLITQRSGVYLKVQKPYRPMIRHELFRWYTPIVVRSLVETSKRQGHGWDQPIGGYSVCFDNTSDDEVKVLLDVVLESDGDEAEEEKKKKKKNLLTKDHLTPLEKNFQESITAAHQILNEMRYMERREKRMKVTADSTNARIRYFSYVGVAVLLSVTWLQVTYLKSYFKKKKLL